MKNFIKKTEDFVCENCGILVRGTGYTNHCNKCLYSKHVDIIPGDRKNICNGIMKPISVIKKNNNLILIHKCLSCGEIKKNKTSKNDNFDAILCVLK